MLGPEHFFPEQIEYLFGLVRKKLNQDVILVFKVEINRSIGHTRFSGNLGYGGLIESLLSKNLDCRFEDAVIFVDIFVSNTDDSLLIVADKIMNEYSFI
jgi:hypothetical protein